MDTKQLTDPKEISRFIHGGHAVFTLVSKTTGTRFTYKVRTPKDKKSIKFVSVMYGSDNVANYLYMGLLRNVNYEHGAKSKLPAEDMRSFAFAWFNHQLVNDKSLEKVEFWHEGRCACCGRRLTVPESIASGIGPECAKRYA